MKKFLWISLLLGLIFLGGCATTNKLSQDTLFQKKQECAKYKDSIQNEIDKEAERLENLKVYYDASIGEIFYSIKENSCFVIINEEIMYLNWNEIVNSVIKDLLTNKIIAQYNNTQENTSNVNYYFEKLKELKWE